MATITTFILDQGPDAYPGAVAQISNDSNDMQDIESVPGQIDDNVFSGAPWACSFYRDYLYLAPTDPISYDVADLRAWLIDFFANP